MQLYAKMFHDRLTQKELIMQILSSTSTLASGTLFVLSLLAASQAALAGNSQVKLEDTKNGSPLKVNADSEQAKQFLATGKNPYIGNQQAIAQGKKLFQLYSCTQWDRKSTRLNSSH